MINEDEIVVNREKLAHILRHGAPDMETTSDDDVARWEDIAADLRAALSERQ